MFHNYGTGENTTDATEQKGDRWYIKMGFAGYNSRANNLDGYASKVRAEAAITRYENKGK
jgi:hypothetical protein